MSDRSYRDEETLRELYHGEGMSAREVGDELGVSHETIRRWMDKHDIEMRDKSEAAENRGTYGVGSFCPDSDGYYIFACTLHGETDGAVRIHNLVAIANGADPYTVFDPEYITHHWSGFKIDNRPDNLEVMTNSEHMQLHATGNGVKV